MISICGQRGASSAAREARDVSAGTTWVKTLWGHRAGIRLTAKMKKTAGESDRRPTQCRDPGGLILFEKPNASRSHRRAARRARGHGGGAAGAQAQQEVRG